MTRTKVKVEHKQTLIQGGPMILHSDNGGTLELIMRNKEPAILVDGRYIIRRSQLRRALERFNDE